ncbi:MAG: signal peptidase I [Candidatus Omnitrophica bacterium]|nr:signal peptidase I [Candidatus Omnitrophota bacterium]
MERRAFFRWRYVKDERRKGYKQGAAALVISIPLFLFLQQYVVATGKVTDVSMLPTLKEGDYFFINKAIYHLAAPRRGEIVVLQPFEDKPWYYVKRIIGLPGETVRIAGGRVWVDGRELDEPYAAGQTLPATGPLTIGADSYFLLGDNRENSEDSRIFGTIPSKRISGRIRAGKQS